MTIDHEKVVDRAIQWTVGAGVNRPVGRLVTTGSHPSRVAALCDALAGLPVDEETWFAAGLFKGNHRKTENWLGCDLITIDVDYCLDTTRSDKGNHIPPPSGIVEEVAFLLDAAAIPGNLAYQTPRGFRLILVLQQRENDADRARRAIRGAATIANEALARLGLAGGPGQPGYTTDSSALDLARCMFAPRAIVDGVSREAEVILLRKEHYDSEELAAASPEGPLLGMPPQDDAVACPNGPSASSMRGDMTEAPVPQGLDELLAKIPADPYDHWIRVGMGLRYTYGEEAYEAWDRWSANSSKYLGPGATAEKWASFRRASCNVVTMGSVVHLARAHGWRGDPSVFSEEDVGPSLGVASWTAYPVELLPASLRDLAIEGSAAIGCDPAMIALPSLVACGGAIGLARAVRIKDGWDEPSVLWAAIVAGSGSRKDPALDLAAAPLRELDEAYRRANARAEHEYSCAKLRYDRDLSSWKRSKTDGEPPRAPEPPRRSRLVTQDATYEALARLVAEVPRASLVAVRGELAAWIREWGEYSGAGRGSSHDSKWLELHGARFAAVDRVGAGEVYVARAAVSVVGAIQPGTLRRVIGPELIESGCAARVIWAMPPRTVSRWSDATVSSATRERYGAVVGRLASLQPETITYADGGTGMGPQSVPLSAGARTMFAEWYNELAETMPALAEAEGAAASKLEGGAARLALIVALASAAEHDEAEALGEIDEAAMAAGIALARWHLGEAQRVLALLGGVRAKCDQDWDNRKLLAWVGEHPGCTAREVAQGVRRFRGPGGTVRAAEVLDSQCGDGRPLHRDDCGRKTRYAVNGASTVSTSTPPVTRDNRTGGIAGSVDVDGVDQARPRGGCQQPEADRSRDDEGQRSADSAGEGGHHG